MQTGNCLIAGVCLYVSAASAQIGLITNVGKTVNNMDAIAFNNTGTLYGALKRLLDDGWIERFEQKDTARDKQAYRLTSAGRVQLETLGRCQREVDIHRLIRARVVPGIGQRKPRIRH